MLTRTEQRAAEELDAFLSAVLPPDLLAALNEFEHATEMRNSPTVVGAEQSYVLAKGKLHRVMALYIAQAATTAVAAAYELHDRETRQGRMVYR